MTVSELLAQAKAAHADYRRLGGAKSTPQQKRPLIQAAYDARLAAEQLDPEHADPAWAKETQHADLLLFYEKFLELNPV